MTATPIAPYLPHLITLARCTTEFIGLHVRYRQVLWQPSNPLYAHGGSRADWDDVKTCIKQAHYPIVRCEIFHIVDNNQLTAVCWDVNGTMLLQVGDVSQILGNLLERLGASREVKDAAFFAVYRHDRDVIVFYDENCGWAHYVPPLMEVEA